MKQFLQSFLLHRWTSELQVLGADESSDIVKGAGRRVNKGHVGRQRKITEQVQRELAGLASK